MEDMILGLVSNIFDFGNTGVIGFITGTIGHYFWLIIGLTVIISFFKAGQSHSRY